MAEQGPPPPLEMVGSVKVWNRHLKWLEQRWFETIPKMAEVWNLCCANFWLGDCRWWLTCYDGDNMLHQGPMAEGLPPLEMVGSVKVRNRHSKWLEQRWFETIPKMAEVWNLCCANFWLSGCKQWLTCYDGDNMLHQGPMAEGLPPLEMVGSVKVRNRHSKWLEQRWFETIPKMAEVWNLCCANF
jgi:hypothetical protein